MTPCVIYKMPINQKTTLSVGYLAWDFRDRALTRQALSHNREGQPGHGLVGVVWTRHEAEQPGEGVGRGVGDLANFASCNNKHNSISSQAVQQYHGTISLTDMVLSTYVATTLGVNSAEYQLLGKKTLLPVSAPDMAVTLKSGQNHRNW